LGQISLSCSEGDPRGSLIPSNVRRLVSAKPYSCFFDQTHDNPCQIERRSVEDVLPRSAIVAMSNCSTGSNRGYDELVPHHIDVVHETRPYPQWVDNDKQSSQHTSMIGIKKALNQLHVQLAEQGFTQVCSLLFSLIITSASHTNKR
jgi:glycogen debranching enzyme